MKRKIKKAEETSLVGMVIICVCLAAMIIAVYWPVYKHQFISYDDGTYIVNNQNIKTLNYQTICWAFKTQYAANWHPLTWLSLAIDYHLFKNWAGGFHIVNVIFHILNTILLFYLFKYLTNKIGTSFFIAAAFALHPLHVESVAWVVERKDVLSMFFWILTMIAYVQYAKSLKIKWYVVSLVLFIFGLMAKPMLVTLPFVLLLLDYWPLERKFSFRLLTEKIPFFVLSVCSSIITFIAQRNYGAMESGETFGLFLRISNAVNAYVFYITKTILPIHLAVLYPHPGNGLTLFKAVMCALLLIAISILFIYLLRKYKFFTFGWLWFLGTLVPVIGLVQVGPQAYADRYSYVPLIGLFVVIAFSAKEFLSKQNSICLAVIILLLWSFMASGWLECWKNDETLYTATLRNTENNHIILGNYINYLMSQKRFDEAIEKSGELLKMKPDSYQGHCNLGAMMFQKGRLDESQEQFKLAVKYKPDLAQGYFNLALVCREKKDFQQAILYYNEAIKLKPDYIDAYFCLGLTYEDLNQFEQAIEIYKAALKIEPNNQRLRYELESTSKKIESK